MKLSISTLKLVTSLLQQSPAKRPTEFLQCQVPLWTAQQQLYKLTALCMKSWHPSSILNKPGVPRAVQKKYCKLFIN